MTITFHTIQKIEIIVAGEKQAFVEDLLQQCGTRGYTIIHDISGLGEHGYHEGRLMFNDQDSLVMFLVVADESVIASVAEGLLPLFEEQSGVMFVTNARVARPEKFTGTGET
jgi:nitrogen regulatory protein PII